MASEAHTTRRRLFAIAGGLTVASTPIAAYASAMSPAEADAATFEAGLSLIDPRLAPMARQAIKDGWRPSDLFSVISTAKIPPALMFAREISVEPSRKRGFEGFMTRTTEYTTYRHGLEPNHDTDVTSFNPNRDDG